MKISIGVLAIVIALSLIGRDHYILGTVLDFSRWIFIITLAVLFVVIFRRVNSRNYRWILALSGVVLLIDFGWNKLSQKRLPDKFSGETSLKVMSYNVFFRNSSLTSSLKLIEDYDPDILAVQELTPELEQKMMSALLERYPYHKSFSLPGSHGIATYSRYPITGYRVLNNYHDHPFALFVDLTVKTRKIQVINVHLASPAVAVEDPFNFFERYKLNYELREEQLRQINRIADGSSSHVDAQILIGDLNTMDSEPMYRTIREHWVNLHDIAGNDMGYSFPNSTKVLPFLRLDYFFGRGKVSADEVRILDGGGSDHLAVTGKLNM